jgi:hypothetical protein
LLIYSIYRISVGPRFLPTDKLQIIFNFSSLESYSALLVFTVIFLARRAIWYDATLLTVIENILVLVPFMLLSHASFVENDLAGWICVAGSLLAIGKLGILKRSFKSVNLPAALLFIGALILVVNVSFPLVFRKGLNFADNQWTNNELWKSRSLYCWYFLLPGLMFLATLLPRSRPEVLKQEAHQKHWFPHLIFGLWMFATTLHLYSIGYIDDQRFEVSHFIPLLWATSWVFCTSVIKVLNFEPRLERMLIFTPAGIPLIPVALGAPLMGLMLFSLNSVVFTYRSLRRQDLPMSLWLSVLSFVGSMLTIPDEWMIQLIPRYDKGYAFVALLVSAGLIWSFRRPTAKSAIVGSVCLAIVGFGMAGQSALLNAAVPQVCLVFILIHSLWWIRPYEKGSELVRFLASSLWILHSIILQFQSGGLTFVPVVVAALMITLVVTIRWLMRQTAYLLAITSGVVLLVPVVFSAVDVVKDTPEGLIPLISSFLLLGIGTAFAVQRKRSEVRNVGPVEAFHRPVT